MGVFGTHFTNDLTGYKCKLGYHGFNVEVKQAATPYSKIRLRVQPKNKVKKDKSASEVMELIKLYINLELSVRKMKIFNRLL